MSDTNCSQQSAKADIILLQYLYQNPDFLLQLLFFFFCFVFQGLTNPLGKPVCSFDPDGLIFAAGMESKAIKLYDLRAFDKVKKKVLIFVV